MLWYLQRLTQAKWDQIWQPTFERAHKISPYFGAGEQVRSHPKVFSKKELFFHCLSLMIT